MALILAKTNFSGFLAGMSSSRSDDVTKSVCVCVNVFVAILFSLEDSKHLQQYD